MAKDIALITMWQVHGKGLQPRDSRIMKMYSTDEKMMQSGMLLVRSKNILAM
jgi:hypothetical protein